MGKKGMNEKVALVLENMEKVMVGKSEVAELSVVALLAQGHVLLEDVPGVGKTMMVRALSQSVDCDFKRIQFTPDLLPSDVVGVSLYNPKEMQFEFRPGPIMGNIVLADEINRTSPKTQSALLEGLEEGSVTVDGFTRNIPKPFFVMATQNPIEYEGTYPLPEAQLDRFLIKLNMGYPSIADEMEVLARTQKRSPIEELTPAITKEQLLLLQEEVKEVLVDETIRKYIVELAQKTRTHEDVYLGVSPRGSIALMKAAQAYAFIQKRDYVIPDDIQFLAPYVFSHRMILRSESRYDGLSAEMIVQKVMEQVAVPVNRLV